MMLQFFFINYDEHLAQSFHSDDNPSILYINKAVIVAK